MAQTPAPVVDLKDVLREVAYEKEIEIERWISALEDAMASAAKKQHHIKEPVISTFDPESGGFSAFIVRKVVEEEELEDPLAEWTLEEAQAHDPEAEIGVDIHIPISTEGKDSPGSPLPVAPSPQKLFCPACTSSPKRK